MEDVFKKALEFSNFRQSFSIQRKVLKEKVDAKLTYGFNGGIFKIDRTLLTFVDMLISQERTDGVVVLDVNDNPILIENLLEFKEEIFDRYFTSTLEYHSEYQKLKQSRTTEKLLDL